ncbi:DNA-binding transcriptional regulator LsrR (DeoR family) [Kribbella antiqua]|uniref:DNA-binding transcriptional regulator LsrR (DeoR family) n=1 Tax=Kribbella antiqua TaxID=2512217 RepID=A0A4R2ITA2_9ACTN|nr:sugar-binding transcriptional regulator [Kribbella antiqua]TCO47772.1 DNA-binding transcriptional regulator LsrR (DeoR family) [Kribbella antiqua]
MNGNRAVRQPGLDELRLLAKVARMYHEKGIRQPKIAAELNLSQARVSRMLKQAVEVGIVHTVVTMPSGVHSDLEDELQGKYGLRDAVVVDTVGDDVLPALGSGAAAYIDMTLTGGHVIGISSWSETLIAAVDRMPRKSVPVVDRVVQIVGGLGDAAVQMQATRLTARFAELTGGMPVYLPAPGLVGTPAVRRAMMNDVSVRDVLGTWGQLTDALVGIGSLEPSPLLQRSGNAVAESDQEELRRLGAVGDVCFRYFDEEGKHVRSTFDQRVIGVTAKELLAVPRRIGVAGGERKYSAIRAALLGGWVNILITDLAMAEKLLGE